MANKESTNQKVEDNAQNITNSPTRDAERDNGEDSAKTPKVARFFNEKGEPVEGSTLPPKYPKNQPDASKVDNVHGRMVDADKTEARTEEEATE